MLRARSLLLLLLLLLASAGPTRAAAALEDLPYRISLGSWVETGRANLSLKELGPGRYLAEFSGGAEGIWTVLSRWLPERYRTEMTLRDGRLQPLVYREELRLGGRRVVKEYRFDYHQGLMEYWRKTDDHDMEKRWQVPLKEPVYDPLSLFYNFRMGAFGPLDGGETIKVQTIPTPDPEELIINLGPETGQGRKVMLTVREQSGKERGPYFFYVGPEWVPRTAWVRVLKFGKLSGQLLDPGAIMQPNCLPPAKPQIMGSN